jgi:fatty-acyl-CoA synthase
MIARRPIALACAPTPGRGESLPFATLDGLRARPPAASRGQDFWVPPAPPGLEPPLRLAGGVLELRAADPRDREPTLAHTIVALRDRIDRGPIFLHDGETARNLSFAVLAARAEDHARALLAAGCVRGERIGLAIGDPECLLVALLGAARIGAVPVPFAAESAARAPASLGGLLRVSGVRRVVVSRAAPEAGLERSLLGFELHVLEDMSLKTDDSRAPGLPDPDGLDLDDLALLHLDADAAGRLRGVRLTHRALAAASHAIMVDGLRCREDDVAVCCLPVHRGVGLLGFALACLRHRVPVVFMAPDACTARPRRWLEGVHRFRGTITAAPDLTLADRRALGLVGPVGLDLSCLRVLACDGAALHLPILRALVDHLAPAGLRRAAIVPCYGPVAASGAVCFSEPGAALRIDRIAAEALRRDGRARVASPDEAAHELVSCGRPLPGWRVLVLDDAGLRVPERHLGHLVVQGPGVADGFEGDPTSSLIFSAAGLHTGDRGYLADGELHVLGPAIDPDPRAP